MDILTNLKKNIISWYPIEKTQTVLQIGQDEQIYNELKCKSDNVTLVNEKELTSVSAKYDFVVLIGVFEKLDTENEIVDILEFSKKCLSDEGKILLAMQNKFGMKYWAGQKIADEEAQYSSIISSRENVLSMPRIKEILGKMQLKFKFYYPLPDYKITNVIYTDDFMPDNDSVDARILTFCEKDEILNFSEREAYKQLIKEDKSLFPFFSNSYFIEISNHENFEDIKYVSYGITRKEEYRIKTIIKTQYAEKTANTQVVDKHVNQIANNIDILNKCNINCLDKFENEAIISKYLNDAKSFDQVLMETYNEKNLDEVIEKIKKFNDKILSKLLTDKVDLKNTVFEKCNIEISMEQKEKLHFTKNGLYDLIFQNCLVENDEIFVYDQEWFEENIPIEFILYRAIFYFTELKNNENITMVYDKLGLTDYIEIFEKLENILQDRIIDKEVWKLHAESVKDTGRMKELLKSYEENKVLSDNHIKNLENNIKIYQNDIENKSKEIENKKKELKDKDEEIKNKEQKLKDKQQQLESNRELLREYENGIQEYRKGIEDLTNIIHSKDAQLVDYANQLRTISNSFSWKITKPIRMASWVLNPFNGASFIDRIYPPGGKRRIEYDKKQYQKYLQKLAKTFYRYVDKELAMEWAILTETIKNQKLNHIDRTDYDLWMKNNEPTQEELEAQRKHRFKYRPKISIVIPLYNTPIDFFKDLLFYMVKQTYSNWELCLADGSPEPLEEIKEIVKKDSRIKYHFIGQNKGISENTNEAIKLATGDYIGLLDHDDFLSEDCLYEVVKCINENPNVEFIYSDEDKTTGVADERYDAYFKPDFAPDTLRSQNYICHFSVFKKEVMDELQGFRNDFDGAQDYDIFLRMSEIVKLENIKHINKILYHWRLHKESTAMQGSAKPWAFDAGQKAIDAHIKRLGLKGNVTNGIALGTYQVEYEPQGNPKVSILIPNKDGISDLKVCVKSILEKTTYSNYEIVIIENNSTDKQTFEYYEELKQNPKIKVVYYKDTGFNYSRIINFGVKNSDGDFIIQLNNDTELITPNWLEKMIGYCQRKEIGAVGVKLYYPDETVQHAGVLLGLGGIAGHLFKFIGRNDFGYFSKAVTIQNMTAVTAACIMTKREIYEEVGFMNEDLAVAFNDIDFCLKIRKAGYLIIYNPYVEFLHYESKSRGSEDTEEKVKRFNNEIEIFQKAWTKELEEGDPYYNINLRLDNDQCAVKTEKVD